ncbi:MAG: hypothetical protein WC936_04630 [Candidatus Nanoarchaeia archaeon]|jgi:hypothetical protein
MASQAEDKKAVIDFLNQALDCVKQAEQLIKTERLIKSRVFYGTIVAGLEGSLFHIERLKYWIEFEKEWPKRGKKQ